MLTLDLRLGWVVRVRPDHLAAHLEIFAKLKPTLDVLRACNRFGQGTEAHITKLPPELIDRIGACLTEPERAKARELWKKSSDCYHGTCKPVDHYSERERISAYSIINSWRDDGPCKECMAADEVDRPMLSEHCENARTELLTADELESLDLKLTFPGDPAHVLRYEGTDGPCDLTIRPWEETHRDNRHYWQIMLGMDAPGPIPLFQEHQTLLARYFGLDVMVSCVQTPLAASDKKQYPGQKASRQTVAYLVLGAGDQVQSQMLKTFHNSFEGSTDDEVFSYIYRHDLGPPVQTGEVLDITMPPNPSATSLRKFPRALIILGLQALQITSGRSLGGDRPSETSKGANTSSVDPVQPVLKLLTRYTDDGELLG